MAFSGALEALLARVVALEACAGRGEVASGGVFSGLPEAVPFLTADALSPAMND